MSTLQDLKDLQDVADQMKELEKEVARSRWLRDNGEKAMHLRVKKFLTKKQQGYVMQAFREVVVK